MTTDRAGERPIETIDVESILGELGYDAESNLLTRRQAEVLVLREQGFNQDTIADWLGCSRANVSSIEGSARGNIEKAETTITFAELLSAPVHVELPAGIDLYEIPDRIFDACDDHGIKVRHGAPELIRRIRDAAASRIEDGILTYRVSVRISAEGSISVLKP